MNLTSNPATMDTPAVPRVLMLGTALGGQGGIATVVGLLRQHGLFEREGVRYVATHVEGTRAAKAGAALSGFGQVLAMLFSQRPALVHVHASSHASFVRKSLLLLCARAAGCKTICHLHGGRFDRYASDAGPLLRRWIRHTLEASSVVIALSARWDGYLRGFAPRARVAVVPNSVPLPPPPGGAAEQPGRILFLGQFGRAKGVYELLEAFAALLPAFPEARLALGGQGELGAVRRRAAELGIEGQVVLLGWIEGPAKQAELERAAVFCLPSHAEGLPMAMLEAMAAGKAVVVTPVGGILDAVQDGDNGLLVAPGQVAQLAGALGRLLGDAGLRRRLGQRARATIAARFDAAVVTARISDIYRELIAAPAK
jgi:glycosyltransferase involved in cell wall biosynthesis